VKSKSLTIKLLAVFSGLLFLAGSTGITIITHHCDACDDHTNTAGFLLMPSEPEDDCCEAADRHCEPVHNSQSLETGCCHFKIGRLQLTNYTPTVSPVVDLQVTDIITEYHQDIFPAKNNKVSFFLPYHNKHGGRALLKHNCQLLI